MHVLDGAYQRVDRAGEHLTEVRRRCKAYGKAISQTVVIERKPETFLLEDGMEVKGVRGQVSAWFGPVPDVSPSSLARPSTTFVPPSITSLPNLPAMTLRNRSPVLTSLSRARK